MTKTAIFGLLVLFALPATLNAVPAQAQSVNTLDPLCKRYDVDDQNAPDVCKEDAATRSETASDNKVTSFILEVIKVMLFALGVVSVVAVIYGGLTYVTAAGDMAKIKKARNTILYAIGGLIIAVSAQLIILFVLDRLKQGL